MDRRREAVLQRTVRDQGGGRAAGRRRTAVHHDRRLLFKRLVRQLDRDLRVRLIVEHRDVQRPALDAARLVEIVGEHLQRGGFRFAEERGAAGRRQHGIDLVRIRSLSNGRPTRQQRGCGKRREKAPVPLQDFGVSKCPPKPKRIAESTLFWKSASPRELKRA